MHSGGELSKIVLVDNASKDKVSDWHEIVQMSSKIQVVRLERMVGLSAAKNRGVKELALPTGSEAMLVFLSSRSIVSEKWLVPLHGSVGADNVVYPAVDIWDHTSATLMPADDNVVAGFTWAMAFRWEDATNDARVFRSSGGGRDSAKYSPATPGVFAVRASYFAEIGGFEESLDTATRLLRDQTTTRAGAGGLNTYYWSHEDISDPALVEFSLRVWLCGGSIIQQPCSRVAHNYRTIFEDGLSVGEGVTQHVVDHTVMRIAEYWFPVPLREVIHQARFAGRVPHTIGDLTSALRSPETLFSVPALRAERCAGVDWFLAEVYPGLATDVAAVTRYFREQLISERVVEKTMAPLLQQYHKETEHSQVSPATVEKIRRFADEDRRSGRTGLVVGGSGVPVNPIAPVKELTDEEKRMISDSSHENHVNFVQDSLVCEDQPTTWEKDDCSVMAGEGDQCRTNPSYMMFGCPKTCGLCGSDGKLCTDYYLNKCPQWKAEGECESNADEMMVKCRLTCGHCKISQPGAVKLPRVQPAVAVVASPEDVTERVDPYVAQRQWHDGLLPDPMVGAQQSVQCEMHRRPNGDLLGNVHVDKANSLEDLQKPGMPRVFCGIYTMESKHANNVQATRETWAKKCTGFVAFSTADDPSIPGRPALPPLSFFACLLTYMFVFMFCVAMAIKHEGEESYNNMWQKSRSIWKHIARHYADEFDYFLMGGDDMFYLVENLIRYLGSEEIVAAQRDSAHGLFLGRRFFPPKQNVFNSGGAGYLLDQKALRLLAGNIDSPKCFSHQVGFWEDVNVANCLRVSSNKELVPYDTRDSQKRERFHPFSPGQHLTYGVGRLDPNDWYVKYNPELKVGAECCSDRSVSFHYIGAELMRKLHAYVYHCPKKPQ